MIGRDNDYEDNDDDNNIETPKARAYVKPQRQEPFKTASHQLAINAMKKNPQSAGYVSFYYKIISLKLIWNFKRQLEKFEAVTKEFSRLL